MTAAVGSGSLAGCFSGSCSPRRTQHNLDASIPGDARWQTQYYDAANTSHNPTARGPSEGVQVAWRHTLCRPSDAGTIVGAETTHLENHVIDTHTGETADEWALSQSTPTISDGVAYFPADSPEAESPHLYAREMSTGETLWTTELPEAEDSSSPAVNGDIVYTAAADLYAMGRESGEERWRFEMPPETDAVGPPAVRGGTAYIAGDNRALYAVDTETGAERWRITSTREGGNAPVPSVANDLVYFAIDEDKVGEIKAVNPADGSVAWRHEIESWLYAPVAVTDSNVFAVGGDGERGFVTALDAETGERQWQRVFDGVNHIATVTAGGESLYAGAIRTIDEAPVYALDQATGEQRWQFETRPRDFGDYTEKKVSAIAAVDEYVFVTTSGEVYALVEQS